MYKDFLDYLLYTVDLNFFLFSSVFKIQVTWDVQLLTVKCHCSQDFYQNYWKKCNLHYQYTLKQIALQ